MQFGRRKARTYNRQVRWLKYAAAAVSVVLVVGVLQIGSVSHGGVAAPLLLLDVVVVARFFGTGPALVAAAAGSAAYSYYFLPPAGFGIEDPENWLAFITFTGTAVIAGELASRAERRTAEAQAGRHEIERLYQELQSAFERASEAEAARRNEHLKAALLDALTHNLRTPLTAIKAAVTALIHPGVWADGSDLSTEGRQELLQVIDEESDRLNRFIEALSRTDSGERAQPLHLRAVEAHDIIQTAVHRADNLTRDHRVAVAIDDGLQTLSVDAASMAEVLYILIDNASKYSPPGTAIRVTAAGEDDHHVRISVIDEGPGIPPELHERVFERFFRVPNRESHDSRRGGVGLGLPIARRLVEAQAGRIWIEPSGAGAGTTVILTLPTTADSIETNRVTAPAAMAAGAGK